MAIADEQLAVSDSYASALAGLEERAQANTTRALRTSLEGSLAELRRGYSLYIDSLPDSVAAGQQRPPGTYTAAQAAGRFRGVLRAAQGYLTPFELDTWRSKFKGDLVEALDLGMGMADELVRITQAQKPEKGTGKALFTPPREGIVEAASRTASAYIEGESVKFRDLMVNIVADAGARGLSPRRMVERVRGALEGVATDPADLNTQLGGPLARARLIARSELQNAYAQASLNQYVKEGYAYIRWVATESERTCPYCAGRHGLIYELKKVVIPAHPRCRCVAVPVPTEFVEEEDPVIRDALLEGGRWRGSRAAVLVEYAKGRAVPIEKARAQTRSAVLKPTASERRRFPGVEEAVMPTRTTDAPKGGKTLEEAIKEREEIAKARKGLVEQEKKGLLADAEEDAKHLEDVIAAAFGADASDGLKAMVASNWEGMSQAEKDKTWAQAKNELKYKDDPDYQLAREWDAKVVGGKEWDAMTPEERQASVKLAQERKQLIEENREAILQLQEVGYGVTGDELDGKWQELVDLVKKGKTALVKVLANKAKHFADLMEATAWGSGQPIEDLIGSSYFTKMTYSGKEGLMEQWLADLNKGYKVVEDQLKFLGKNIPPAGWWDNLSVQEKIAQLDLLAPDDWKPGQLYVTMDDSLALALANEMPDGVYQGLDSFKGLGDPDKQKKLDEAWATLKDPDGPVAALFKRYGDSGDPGNPSGSEGVNWLLLTDKERLEAGKKALQSFVYDIEGAAGFLGYSVKMTPQTFTLVRDMVKSQAYKIDGYGLLAYYHVKKPKNQGEVNEMLQKWRNFSYTQKAYAIDMDPMLSTVSSGKEKLQLAEKLAYDFLKQQYGWGVMEVDEKFANSSLGAQVTTDAMAGAIVKDATDLGLMAPAGKKPWEQDTAPDEYLQWGMKSAGLPEAQVQSMWDAQWPGFKESMYNQAVDWVKKNPPSPVMSAEATVALTKLLTHDSDLAANIEVYKKLTPEQQEAFNTWAKANKTKTAGTKKPTQADMKALGLDYAIAVTGNPLLLDIKTIKAAPGAAGHWASMSDNTKANLLQASLKTLQSGTLPDQPKAKPVPSTAPAKPTPPVVDPADVVTIDGIDYYPSHTLGGSTGAKLYKDVNGVASYVVKTSKRAGHVDAEYAANQVYKAVADQGGLNIKAVESVNIAEGVIANKYVSGSELRYMPKDDLEALGIYKQLREGTLVDAVLANWDVVGLSKDNLIWDASENQLLRIDNGSSFDYRAQGAAKLYKPVPMDLFSMREGKGQLGAAWAGAEQADYRKLWTDDLGAVVKASDAMNAALDGTAVPRAIKDVMAKRLELLEITRDTLGSYPIANMEQRFQSINVWERVDAEIKVAFKFHDAMGLDADGGLEATLRKRLSKLSSTLEAEDRIASARAKRRAELMAGDEIRSGADLEALRGSSEDHDHMPWGPTGGQNWNDPDVVASVERVYADYLNEKQITPEVTKWSKDMLWAMDRYTNGNYRGPVYEWLTRNNPEAAEVLKDNVGSEPYRSSDNDRIVENLEEFIDAMPVWRGGTISRGVSMRDDALARRFIDTLDSGSGGVFGAVQSFRSGDPDDNSWGFSMSSRVLMILEDPQSGVSVRNISHHGVSEEEVLMGTKAKYEVVRVEEKAHARLGRGRDFWVYLREVF